MSDEPRTAPPGEGSGPQAPTSEADAVWVDGAPFTTAGGIVTYTPQLLAADLLRSHKTETGNRNTPMPGGSRDPEPSCG